MILLTNGQLGITLAFTGSLLAACFCADPADFGCNWLLPAGSDYTIRDSKNVTADVYKQTFAFDLASESLGYKVVESKDYKALAVLSESFAVLSDNMATAATPFSGIPLQEYRKDTPPGWSPGLPDYPLRLYFEKVKLWYRCYEGTDESVGPMLAGRLQGRAQKIALGLRLVRPDGQYDVGDSALVRLTVDEVRDPMDPTQILQHHIPSGVQALATALRDAFGQSDQELTTSSLEAFFGLKRGRLSLQEYAAEWELRYEEAQTRAGLDVNDVAKTFLFFQNSGLPNKFIEDVKLQIQGDMSRFQEARRLALRLSGRGENSSLSTDLYGEWDQEPAHDPYAEWYGFADGYDGQDWWQEDEGWHDDSAWYADESDGGWWYQEEEEWFSPEGSQTWETEHHHIGDDVVPSSSASAPLDQAAPSQIDEYYQHKGRGGGCHICGSRWHHAAQCPVNTGSKGSKGQPSSSSWRPKGKGKSKGKYRPPGRWRKGGKFGGKGFGGKGKGKSGWKSGKSQLDYYAQYDYDYESYSRQLPERGLHLDEPTNTPKYHAFTKPVTMTPSDKAELLAWRGPEATPVRDADGNEEPAPRDPAVRKLSFTTHLHAQTSVFHTVHGVKRRGLLIDPGAAAGLIGSETLRDLMESCHMKPEDVTWTESTASITGISGEPDKALGRVKLKLPFKNMEATFTADVIGKSGSLCPALVGNPALCEMRFSLHSRWFDNGDGLLVTWDVKGSKEAQMHTFRVLLTDSGHYLLPLDVDSEVPEEQKEVCHFIRNLSETSHRRWPDHSYVFWQTMLNAGDSERQWSDLRSNHTNGLETDTKSDKQKKTISFATEEMIVENDEKETFTQTTEEPKTTEQQLTFTKTTEERMTTEKSSTSVPQDGCHPVQILATNLTDLPLYVEDTLPTSLSAEEVKKLQKDYRAMPEEFYTKSNRRVVTPSNFSVWFKESKKHKARWQVWELCSGSGRFSLLCTLAGLMIGFPIDFRYGWNLGDPEHQDMLRQAYDFHQPDVLLLSPRCKFWSVSASRRDYHELMQDRESERPALVFMQSLITEQVARKKAYVMEQPWSSAMWTESVMATNKHLAGWRKAKRTDQCAFGASDERRQPVLKATGLEANFKLRMSLRRCNGHRGQAHVPLQGQHNGMNRTAMAAVYPTRFCKGIIQDILVYLKVNGSLRSRFIDAWHVHQILYSCERCKFGRAALPDMEHTFIPGECRYGRDPGKKKGKSIEAAVSSSPSLDFQRAARQHAGMSDVKITVHEQHELNADDKLYLKYLMCTLVEESMSIFDEVTDGNYTRWIDDPIMMACVRACFKKIMYVHGVQLILHPFAKAFPEPRLQAAQAPLRVICRGEYKEWSLEAMEDLRELSPAQQREEIQEENWMITFFGSSEAPHSSPLTPMPSTPAPMTPAPGTPAPGTPAPTRASSSNENPALEGTPEQALVPVPRPGEIAPYEEVDLQAPLVRTIKPLYSVKRVLQKLPDEAIKNPHNAKRLLLGLHEKMWHATASDFSSLLLRAGMPTHVLDLVGEVVASCQICRRYARLPSKPKTKATMAGQFGDEVEMDIYYLWGKPFVLLIDVGTRYKVSYETPSRELPELLKGILNHWIRFFGPMLVLTTDQETALMGPTAAIEFERMNITRNPKGTTAGEASKQHTGTGIVERHVALLKLTMQKMKAECERQGLVVEDDDIAVEAAMSHNICITYGGYTPSMAVFGVLPRSFYEFESPTLTAVQGAQDRDLTVFESAMRLRQISLGAVQQAIAEDRVARAMHARPHKLPVDQMIPGTTTVEIHRDNAWRGPATLLEVNEDEGTAIVKHQGKPYLLPLRFVRVFQGIYFNMDVDAGKDLHRMMVMVEQAQQYKQHYLGYKMTVQSDGVHWKQVPAEPTEDQQQMLNAFTQWEVWTQHPVHAVLFGQSLKALHPMTGTRGTLLIWLKGTSDYVKIHKNNDTVMKVRDAYAHHWEELCLLYLFHYVMYDEAVIQSSSTPMTVTPSLPPPIPPMPMDVEERVVPFKRDVRDTEPPQGESTPKRFRAEGFVDTKEYQNLHTVYWMIDRSRKMRLHLQEFWADTMKIPKWFSSLTTAMVQQMAKDRHAGLQQQCSYLVQFPSMRERQFYVDLAGNGCFVSMTAEDNIAENDLASIWPLVEEADAKEIAQFVDEKAFEPVRLQDAPEGTVIVDGTWVRRWKWKLGKRIVKSRMCARGCFDPQKDFLATRSTTASRLSQRILISTAALMGEDPESWDVSGAFLKGLTFDRIRSILLSQGIKTPIRSVILVPPFNVWRHLAAVDPKFHLEPHMIPDYGLWCLKPIYGLNDAPVAWQLSLGEFLKTQKGTASLLDDSFYFWKDAKQTPSLQGALTTHVDDLAVVGSTSFKKHLYEAMCKQFGQISKDHLPFSHCGCLYSKTETGLKIDQASFAEKLKAAPNPEGSDDRFLKPEEVTQFRSVLGALLWLCSTRLDIISEVGVLQSSVTNAQVKHLRMANQLVKKASAPDRVQLGLHYKFFPKNMKFRIQCIHDAASPTKERSYAQEGILIYMMPELPAEVLNQDEISCDDATVAQLCDYGHLLFAHGGKSKRVSYSTSHSETLAAIGGLEASSMVSTRLTELWTSDPKPSLKMLTKYQEGGPDAPRLFPVDTATDCRDFFELCTGSRSLPQDKSQRLYVLAVKEARVSGRLRYLMLWPTQSMLADALTKPMTSLQLMQTLSSGFIEIKNEEKHHVLLRRLPVLGDIKEEDLHKADEQLWQEAREGRATLFTAFWVSTMRRPWAFALMTALFATGADAMEDGENTSEDSKIDYSFILFIFGGYVALRVIENFTKWILQALLPHSSSSGRKKKGKKEISDDSDEPYPKPKEKRLVLDPPEASTSSSSTEPRRRAKLPRKVWMTPTGECYHLNPSCSGLNKNSTTTDKRLCLTCERSQSVSGV